MSVRKMLAILMALACVVLTCLTVLAEDEVYEQESTTEFISETTTESTTETTTETSTLVTTSISTETTTETSTGGAEETSTEITTEDSTESTTQSVTEPPEYTTQTEETTQTTVEDTTEGTTAATSTEGTTAVATEISTESTTAVATVTTTETSTESTTQDAEETETTTKTQGGSSSGGSGSSSGGSGSSGSGSGSGVSGGGVFNTDFSKLAENEKNEETTQSAPVSDKENSGIKFADRRLSLFIGSPMAYLDNRLISVIYSPYIQKSSNSTLVSVRSLQQGLGNEVRIDWFAGTKTAVVRYNGHTASITANKNYMVADDKRVNFKYGAFAEIKDGRMYLPFRALGESLGFEVSWDASRRMATYLITE